ncbi:MAG: reprolysin-like metallopeptidase [Leucothrix sp.]
MMKWIHLLSKCVVLSCVAMQPVYAAAIWQDIDQNLQARAVVSETMNVKAKAGRRLVADVSQLEATLLSNDVMSLPLPDGSMARYQFSRSSVMPEALALKYPQIQTFQAVDMNNPANRGRFDITPQGFHGMFQHNGQWVFIDPEVRDDAGRYLAYYGADAEPLSARPSDKVTGLTAARAVTARSPFSNRPLSGSTLRTYRLAMSASAEYTSYHGGKTRALAAIVTLLNRVNEVYERDVSITFKLVANNDDIIYSNRFTDPYDNTSADAETNALHLPTVVPNSTYDIGHVLNTGGGGSAYLAGVCQRSFKSVGVTGAPDPTGDAFYIDYVAHELGHQLGANHTFNGRTLNCGRNNREATSAWEPGSGSTIMGYAGICGAQDLQANSDPYFHTGSIQQILETAGVAGCGVVSNRQNAIPIADAGADFTIPANVPFKLTGSGSDADGDSLTYIWEQYDLGTSSSGVSSMIDNGSRPLFRSWEPLASPVRYLPDLADYQSGTLKLGETLPTTNRELNFRLTVRDGKGGVATDEMTVTVVAGGSTFAVTAPAEGTELVSGTQSRVQWNVANTRQSSINCGSVDILMSLDGGNSFTNTIASNTPNDGEHEFTVGSALSSVAVVMVRCASSGFFALSRGSVKILSQRGTGSGSNTSSGSTGSSTNNSGGGSGSLWFLMLCVATLVRRFKSATG